MKCDGLVRPASRSLLQLRATGYVDHVDLRVPARRPREPDVEPDVDVGGQTATTMSGPVMGGVHLKAAVSAHSLSE